jgi:multidrug efflux system membrane fusion protein
MKRFLTFVVILAAVIGVIWWQRDNVVPWVVRTLPASASYIDKVPGLATAEAPKPQPKGPPPIPVTSGPVKADDFPVDLAGLGTVQSYNTVTVKSRVDGQITKVFFKQGQMVREGDMLVQIDPRPYQAALDQAKAKKAADEASLKDAQLNLTRYTTLNKQNFATTQQLDTQQTTVNQLLAQIQGDDAAIDTAQVNLDYTSIKSPLTGKTGFRLVDPGNIVHATDTGGIVTIVQLQPISVVFTAPQDAVSQINKALAAGQVPVDALSSDGQTVLSHGHLALVDNQVTAASGAISMKATFQNDDNALWPGLSVTTRMLVETLKNVVVVPEDAVQHGPNGLYAFVIGDDNKVAQQSISVGQTGNGNAVITKGLAAGQTVIVEGQYRVQSGSIVKATPMGAPDTGQKVAEQQAQPKTEAQ